MEIFIKILNRLNRDRVFLLKKKIILAFKYIKNEIFFFLSGLFEKKKKNARKIMYSSLKLPFRNSLTCNSLRNSLANFAKNIYYKINDCGLGNKNTTHNGHFIIKQ